MVVASRGDAEADTITFARDRLRAPSCARGPKRAGCCRRSRIRRSSRSCRTSCTFRTRSAACSRFAASAVLTTPRPICGRASISCTIRDCLMDLDRAVERLVRALREQRDDPRPRRLRRRRHLLDDAHGAHAPHARRQRGSVHSAPHRATATISPTPACAPRASVGATLVVTCDCGTSALAPSRSCRRSGIDVIVTDHHLPGGRCRRSLRGAQSRSGRAARRRTRISPRSASRSSSRSR